MTEQSTIVVYPLDGTNRKFVVPYEYLARSFNKVTLLGDTRRELTLGTDYRFITANQIETTQAWGEAGEYTAIELKRTTPAAQRLVDFYDGSVLRSRDLNISAIQAIHIAAEAKDAAQYTLGENGDGDLDARLRKVVNLKKATKPTDAVPFGQLEGYSDIVALEEARVITEEYAEEAAFAVGEVRDLKDQTSSLAQTATEKATQSTEQAVRSENAADRAETAADVAMSAGWVYATVSAGRAARDDGDYFWVVSADDNAVLELWLMGATTASDTRKRTPSKSMVDKVLEGTQEHYDFSVIEGSVVINDPNNSNLVGAVTDHRRLDWIDVSDVRFLVTTKDTLDNPYFKWVFADESWTKVGVSSTHNNGIHTVPLDAKWASRTVKSPLGETDLSLLKIGLIYRDGVGTVISNRLDAISENLINQTRIPTDFTIIKGKVVNTEAYPTTPLVININYDSIDWIDVSDVSTIIVDKSINDHHWVWVFYDEDWNWLGKSKTFGDGIHTVPLDAKWASRTIKGITVSEDLSLFTISLEYKSGNGVALSEKINNLDSTTKESIKKINELPFDFEVVYGELVRTDNDNSGNVLNRIGGVRLEWVDVSDANYILVEGDTRGDGVEYWQWRFVDENWDKVGVSGLGGNGKYTVPDGAKWASRTVKVANDESDLSLLKIYLSYKSGVGRIISEKINNLESLIESSRIALEMKIQSLDAAKSIWRSGFISPNDFEGVTQTDRIKNAVAFIKKRGGGLLELAVDTIDNTTTWVITEAIVLPSNCWVFINHAKVKQADGVFDNWFRNDGIVPDPDPYKVAAELNENHNIRIFGSGMASASLEGPDIPYTAPHPINGGEAVPWVGDFYGWRAIPVLFANVKSYKIHDLSISKTTMWAISQEHGCDDFEVYNIEFETYVKNGDGVDVRIGCSNGKIHHIYGYTSDDTIALTALGHIAPMTWPNGPYIFPLQVGGSNDRGFGINIENIEVSDVIGSGAIHGLILLCGSDSQMHNINVDRISDGGTKGSGAYGQQVVSMYSGSYGPIAAMGDITNIFVNNIKSDFSPCALRLSMPLQDSHVNFVQQYRNDGVAIEYGYYSAINVEVTNTVEPN